MLKRSITVAELNGMTAEAIQALPCPMEIKDGDLTIGTLVPIPFRRIEASAQSSNLRQALDRLEKAEAERTPEEQAAIDEILRERGIE